MNEVAILTGPPRVRVLAYPALDLGALDEFAREQGLDGYSQLRPASGYFGSGEDEYEPEDAERLPELAGALCYGAFGDKASGDNNAKYLARVRNAKPFGHFSIEYHTTLVFLVEGVSRNLTHELIRHYVGCNRDEQGAPSQESTRYVEHPGTFVCPPAWVGNDGMCVAFKIACQAAYEAYLNATTYQPSMLEGLSRSMERKRTLEAARGILPGSATTRLVWSANPVALRKMFTERGHEAADLEFRRLVGVWRPLCEERWPNLFPRTLRHRGYDDGRPNDGRARRLGRNSNAAFRSRRARALRPRRVRRGDGWGPSETVRGPRRGHAPRVLDRRGPRARAHPRARGRADERLVFADGERVTRPSRGAIERAAVLAAEAAVSPAASVAFDAPRSPTVAGDLRAAADSFAWAVAQGVPESVAAYLVAATAILLSAEAAEKEAKARQ
jgi:thymidylate synthase (FAD)